MKDKFKKLKEPIPFKWRIQSCKWGKCSAVAYIDSRDVQDRLDDVIGAENWQDEYQVINGSLYCGVSIKIGDEWITKWDVGSESNIEKEKGNSSDSFKRAAVKWGVGRFLYSLPVLTLVAKEYQPKGGKAIEKPFHNGSYIWDNDTFNKVCNEMYKSGNYDATKGYTQPTQPKKENEDQNLKQALEYVDKCKTIADLIKLWNDYKNLRENINFVDAVKFKRQQLEKK